MREYFETFFRRKWLFFVPFFLVLGAAVAGGVYLSWQYQVESRLWIEQNQMLGGGGETPSIAPANPAEEYSRLSALLQTDDFLRRVVDSVPQLTAEASTPQARDAQILALRRNLNAWIAEQKLITFRYRARDPQVAQSVVSNTISLFLSQRYQDRIAAADTTLNFWQSQYDDFQQRLEQSSTQLAQWEAAHPPATRASLPQSDQLEYQRLKNNYDAIYAGMQDASAQLERARFGRAQALAQHNSMYVLMDPPVVPESPELSANRMASIVLVGLAVAAGLGFTFVALATWFGGRRVKDDRTAIPAWLDRMMAREEQTA